MNPHNITANSGTVTIISGFSINTYPPINKVNPDKTTNHANCFAVYPALLIDFLNIIYGLSTAHINAANVTVNNINEP